MTLDLCVSGSPGPQGPGSKCVRAAGGRRLVYHAFNLHNFRFQEAKGLVVTKSVSSLRDLEEYNFDVIVNCLGLGTKQFLQDHKLVPIRGQVLKVKAEK